MQFEKKENTKLKSGNTRIFEVKIKEKIYKVEIEEI